MNTSPASPPLSASPSPLPSSPSPQPLFDLEHYAAPYLRAGYTIVSQTHSSLTLLCPQPPFSTALFVVLLIVFWPGAIIYSVSNRNGRGQMVCLRVTSQGAVEATGEGTLERRREAERRAHRFAVVVAVLLVMAVSGAGLWLFIKGSDAPITQAASSDEGRQQGNVAADRANFAHSTSSGSHFPAPRRTAKNIEDTSISTNRSTTLDHIEAPASTLAAANMLAPAINATATKQPSPAPSNAVQHPEPLRLVSEGATLFASEHTADPVYRRTEVDIPAQITERPAPAFTAEGVQTSGVVRLQAVLRSTGEVSDITVVKGLPHGLTWCAIAAARRIRFRPAMKSGKAVSMQIQLEYSFNSEL